MASRNTHKVPLVEAPWLTAQGLDFSRFPIDSVLQQALSPDEETFRTGCTLLNVMSHGGRVEAGVFLIGLLSQYPDNYRRLTVIVEALRFFPTVATVRALAAELRRVKGSSATRGYLRRIIDTLESFPAKLAGAQICELCFDPQVGTRFRQHLQALAFRYEDE